MIPNCIAICYKYLLNPGVISIAFSPHSPPPKGVEEGDSKKLLVYFLLLLYINTITMICFTSYQSLARRNLGQAKRWDCIQVTAPKSSQQVLKRNVHFIILFQGEKSKQNNKKVMWSQTLLQFVTTYTQRRSYFYCIFTMLSPQKGVKEGDSNKETGENCFSIFFCFTIMMICITLYQTLATRSRKWTIQNQLIW